MTTNLTTNHRRTTVRRPATDIRQLRRAFAAGRIPAALWEMN